MRHVRHSGMPICLLPLLSIWTAALKWGSSILGGKKVRRFWEHERRKNAPFVAMPAPRFRPIAPFVGRILLVQTSWVYLMFLESTPDKIPRCLRRCFKIQLYNPKILSLIKIFFHGIIGVRRLFWICSIFGLRYEAHKKVRENYSPGKLTWRIAEILATSPEMPRVKCLWLK